MKVTVMSIGVMVVMLNGNETTVVHDNDDKHGKEMRYGEVDTRIPPLRTEVIDLFVTYKKYCGMRDRRMMPIRR